MKFFFYLTGFLSIYSYFVYPLLLKLLPARKPGKMLDASLRPSLSMIITAHNEQARIEEKIINSLDITYPGGELEIIVASDCSTDDTDSIVEAYAERGVRLVRADARKGKEYAQLCAIRQAKGDIIVFSDVATRIEADALEKLSGYFLDQSVGAISSEDRFVSQDGTVAGEGAYVKYEMWLRGLESERAGLVGLSGSFFAARREVCEQWDIYSPSDFNTALNCAQLGRVAINCPDVVGIYKDVKDPGLEYRRKQRTVIRGITAVSRHLGVLNPFTMGMFALQVWSHKILRWGVPWFMAAFLVISVMLYGQGLSQDQGLVWLVALAVYAQAVFYGLALAGWLISPLRSNAIVKIIFFFVQTNLALAHATVLFLFGKRMTVWTPSKR